MNRCEKKWIFDWDLIMVKKIETENHHRCRWQNTHTHIKHTERIRMISFTEFFFVLIFCFSLFFVLFSHNTRKKKSHQNFTSQKKPPLFLMNAHILINFFFVVFFMFVLFILFNVHITEKNEENEKNMDSLWIQKRRKKIWQNWNDDYYY